MGGVHSHSKIRKIARKSSGVERAMIPGSNRIKRVCTDESVLIRRIRVPWAEFTPVQNLEVLRLHHLRKPAEVKEFLERVGKGHGSIG